MNLSNVQSSLGSNSISRHIYLNIVPDRQTGIIWLISLYLVCKRQPVPLKVRKELETAAQFTLLDLSFPRVTSSGIRQNCQSGVRSLSTETIGIQFWNPRPVLLRLEVSRNHLGYLLKCRFLGPLTGHLTS